MGTIEQRLEKLEGLALLPLPIEDVMKCWAILMRHSPGAGAEPDWSSVPPEEKEFFDRNIDGALESVQALENRLYRYKGRL